MAISYLIPTWQEYHGNILTLAEKILRSQKHIGLIVAISRGGLTVGHILTDLLQIPISIISIQSYTDIQSTGELKILEGLHVSIEQKRVLLVDDVSDTGRTFNRALNYLQEFKPLEIMTASVYLKPQSVYKPHYYIQETTKWIVFPYENTETILSTINRMKKEGNTHKEIITQLLRMGYTQKQIHFVEKFYQKNSTR